MPYIKEAGVLFAFYATGVLVFLYLATYHISETQYLAGEEGVVVPVHVAEELELVGKEASVAKSELTTTLNEIRQA